ncbi:putative RNA-directed DNA polymerase from transposon BS [Trichonephila clavipes]|nr:putative RNA-directed DNA polymerase from transposon BS [Trichonephila clavipes]
MVSWEYLWPTLRCRRVAGVSPLLSIGWWYLSSVSPKRHCCRVSAADKGCRVYPLDPRPDAVALCSGCTPGLVLPNPNIDQISANTRYLLLALPNKEMSNKSPFAVHKALIGIGGEPKTVKCLRSGDLLIETNSAIQTKSFLLDKTFLNSPLIVTPHKSLNSCRGVISEPDLLTTSESEILEGFSDQGVIQLDILIAKFARTFRTLCAVSSARGSDTLKLPVAVNLLALDVHLSVGHASTDCILEPKCINCSLAHSAYSKFCPKWRIEKQIQEIETSKNISYPEARKLIVPQTSQTYFQVAKTSTAAATTQTDETITKIVCPALKLLQPLKSVPKPTTFSLVPAVLKSSTSTQAQLLPSTSSVIVTSSSNSQPPIPLKNTAPSTVNNLSTSAASSSSTISMSTSLSASPLQNTTTTSNTMLSTSQDAKQTSKPRKKKRPPTITSTSIKPKIEIKMTPHKPRKPAPVEYTTDEEDMIVYDI